MTPALCRQAALMAMNAADGAFSIRKINSRSNDAFIFKAKRRFDGWQLTYVNPKPGGHPTAEVAHLRNGPQLAWWTI